MWQYSNGYYIASTSTTIIGTQADVAWLDDPFNKEQKANQMSTEQSVDKLAMDHFLDRAQRICWDKEREAFDQYGLRDAPNPKDKKEFKKYFEDGWMQLSEDFDEDRCRGPWTSYIIFRDPSVKKDVEGYDAAVKQIYARHTEVRDVIFAKTAEDALAAVKEFEAEDFGPKSKRSK